jgi:hypothetical protein
MNSGIIFKVPAGEHVLIFRRKGRYSPSDPPRVKFGPFGCFVWTIFNRYELEFSLKRWVR